MNYAANQRNPGKHFSGLVVVVLFHVVLVYALVTGLAKKVVDVVKGPLEAKLIEQVKPPPPDEAPPPPPKLVPPPPFVPPPEVTIAAPQAAGPTISAVTSAPPPPAAPPAPPVAA